MDGTATLSCQYVDKSFWRSEREVFSERAATVQRWSEGNENDDFTRGPFVGSYPSVLPFFLLHFSFLLFSCFLFFFFCFYFFHLVLRPLELAWFIAKKINGYVNPPEQALPSPSSLLRFIDAPNQYIRNKREINGGKLVILTVPR